MFIPFYRTPSCLVYTLVNFLAESFMSEYDCLQRSICFVSLGVNRSVIPRDEEVLNSCKDVTEIIIFPFI